VKRVAAAILVAGVVPAAASATESTIYPGVGIGKVKLGMTLSQVKRALRGKLMLPSGRQRLSGGKQYAEYIWNYSEYRVGFVDGKAAVIGTFLRRQRVNGLGVGSDREVVKANLGAVTCRAAQQLPGAGGRYVRVLPQNDTEYGLPAVRAHGVRPVCVLGPDGRATVFYTGGEYCDSITKKCEKYVVREVLVTRPYTTRSFVQADAPWLPR